MKLHQLPAQQARQRGSILLITMIFVFTVAAIAASYLLTIQNTHQLVGRSQHWNESLALAEAGVEEGMAGLNSPVGFTSSSRTLSAGKYGVMFFPGSKPYLLATGMVTAPLTGDTISRRVKVYVQTLSAFMVGLGTINNIDMNGNGIAADSWNSHDPNQSNNGLYNGFVGTNSSVASAQGIVDIGNHTIDGSLYLGPNASSSYTSGSSSVTGTVYTDWNVNFPDAYVPTIDSSGNPITWTPAPTSGTGNSTVHNFTTSGYYTVNDNYGIQVAAGVTVYVDDQQLNANPNSLVINGGTTNSGSLRLYMESGSITLGGNAGGGAVNNRPENFYLYGLPNVTSITLSGNTTFVGAIYAPEATLTLNGGGNNNNLIGSAIVNSVKLDGHYDFHYDTSLATNGPPAGYAVSSWQEF